ncbi:MAG: hypothetical protein U1E65_01305 [Myxococcota bacterium]
MKPGPWEELLARAQRYWKETGDVPLPERVGEMAAKTYRQARRQLIRETRKVQRVAMKQPLAALTQAYIRTRRQDVYPNSVLHISYMVHIPYYTTQILRRQGMRADYLAVGMQSPWWNKYDYHYSPAGDPWEEFRVFWDIIAKYEVIHSHFGMGISTTGWEFAALKALGRKIVVHYRGCEVRDPVLNQRLHPQVNICQQCDYGGSVCREGKPRVDRIAPYADLSLVTTPDMQDFVPSAKHFPFFCPEINPEDYAPLPRRSSSGGPFKIVHATNHPGIEGTQEIEKVIAALQAKGHNIDFRFLKAVKPEAVLEELRDADLSIGKMKMGYYANAQIESMYLGVPAVTWVRADLHDPRLDDTGLILTDLEHLEETLGKYLRQPEALEEKRRLARQTVLNIHSNERLGRWLSQTYAALKAGSRLPDGP